MEPPHAPTLRRKRAAVARSPYRDVPYTLVGGFVVAALLILLPFLWPDSSLMARRIGYLGSLYLLIASLACWLGARSRGYLDGFIGLFLLYAISSTGLLFGVDDVQFVALVGSLLLFVGAGFQLLFVVEEAVFDLHRMARNAGRVGALVPIALIVLGAASLPFLEDQGVRLRTTAALLPLALFLLLVGIAMGLAKPERFGPLQREMHYLASGVVVGGLLTDYLRLLPALGTAAPSIVMYVALILTWILVGYTTVHRVQLLLGKGHPRAWTLLLHSSLFALIAHSQDVYATGGSQSLEIVSEARTIYLIIGVVLGLLFFAVRAVGRVFKLLGEASPSPEERMKLDRIGTVLEGGASFPERIVESARKRQATRRERSVRTGARDPSRRRPDRRRPR